MIRTERGVASRHTLLEQTLRFIGLAQPTQRDCEVVHARERPRMTFAEHAIAAFERIAQERFCVGRAFARQQRSAEIALRDDRHRRVRAEHASATVPRGAIELLGFIRMSSALVIPATLFIDDSVSG